jgi:hypothetical protein
MFPFWLNQESCLAFDYFVAICTHLKYTTTLTSMPWKNHSSHLGDAHLDHFPYHSLAEEAIILLDQYHTGSTLGILIGLC